MRPTPHLERRLARFESLPRSVELDGPACEGWRGAAQQKGAAAGLLTRKAHPWVDSRPSEDQAAFAGRGRSDEGLALWLPSLSDPVSVAHPPGSIASCATPYVAASPLAHQLPQGRSSSPEAPDRTAGYALQQRRLRGPLLRTGIRATRSGPARQL
jgi:hypothetical protein